MKKPGSIRWILLTGLSGSGKTTVLKMLEDQGFFTIDNLPFELLPSLIQLLKRSKKNFPRIVLGMDVREKKFLEHYTEFLQTLRGSRIHPEIIFLESRDDVLIRRFSENRRPHPLGRQYSLPKAIAEERRLLRPLKKSATRIYDTSEMNVHILKKAVRQYLNPARNAHSLALNLLSFGFKYGPPLEADIFFDVRFLANPYFVPKLKDLDGRARSVQNFVLKQKDAKTFLKQVINLLKFLVPRYQKEGKSYLTVAFGCTGGKHRSIAIVEGLGKKLGRKKAALKIVHRDIEK